MRFLKKVRSYDSTDIQLSNSLWESLPKDKEAKVLVIRDGSASMTWNYNYPVTPL